MGKIFTIIGSVLLSLILVAAVVIFGFEKDIPADWVSRQVEQIKEYEAETPATADEIPNGTVTMCYERLTYAKEGDKTVTTIAEKTEYTMTKSGEGEKLKIKLITINYTNNGQTKTTIKQNIYYEDGKYYMENNNGQKQEIPDIDDAVMSYTYLVDELYVFSPKLKVESSIIDMIDNNLVKVTQKGLKIKFYLEKDNVASSLSYNVAKGEIVGYTQETKTYDGDSLVSKETYKLYM